MKGMVFTEFIDMVEQRYTPELMDEVIEAVAPPSRGAYTAVGQYDHRELVSMVVELSARTGAPVSGPVNTFGEYLFGRVHKGSPQLFAGAKMRFRCCPASTRKYAGSIRMPAAFRHRRRRREYP